ncbi:sensor histidine kinase [Spirosoma soli]|uniref:histidine kinase n=1 Tax=Spirosoma soli TaxID=1770529 RepID=A0ABW5M8F7_9BACT
MVNSSSSAPPNRSSISLASYLFARREAILNMWRASCEADPALRHTASLSREEFNNEIPVMLNIFEQRLQRLPEEEKLHETASAHGLHRWHKGYSLRELLTELNHFTQCLSTELSCYVQFYPTADSSELAQAYAQIVQFSSELVDGSVTRYDDLQRKQAAGRADALQETLDRINALTQQRGKLLQMTSHDLRGGFGVINGAASLLDRPTSTDQERKSHLQMLQRTLLSVSSMLAQLTDLSRLEAGQESLSVESVNVSNLLRSIVESAQPLAQERGLVLRADGSVELIVDTDRVKLQRIVQNLLLNALQNTPSGMVSVSWSGEDNYRWTLGVQDTGTGLPDNLTASFTAPLKPTVDSSSVFSKEKSDDAPTGHIPAPAKISKKKPVSGEGIGLYIVKRLGELLNANIDIETRPGQGTLFRIRLPAHYKLDNE